MTRSIGSCLVAILFLCPAAAEEPAVPPGPESELDAAWKTACEWGVGSAAQRVKDARQKLISMGEPALRRAIARLATTDGLEMESAQAVIAGMGAPAALPLVEAATNDLMPDQVLREAMSLLSSLKQKGALSPEALKLAEAAVIRNTRSTRLPVRLRALLVASDFGLRQAIPDVVALAKDPSETVRRGVAMILGKFGGAEVVEPLVALLHDRLMTVRFPAQDALGQIGPAAAQGITAALAREPDAIARRHLLVALGATAADTAEEVLARHLAAADPIDRGFALRGYMALLESRRDRATKLGDGPDSAAASEQLKADARRIAALAAGDTDPFVQAVRRMLGKTAEAILAPAADAGKK